MSFVMVPVPGHVVTLAHAVADAFARKKPMGLHFDGGVADPVWVGALGEIMYWRWLRDRGVHRAMWVMDMPEQKAGTDIYVPPWCVDVKTTERAAPPQAHWHVEIAAAQIDNGIPTSHYCWAFMREGDASVMWLAGGITKQEFLARARFCAKGEQIRDTFRAPNDLYSIPVSYLMPPGELAASLEAA